MHHNKKYFDISNIIITKVYCIPYFFILQLMQEEQWVYVLEPVSSVSRRYWNCPWMYWGTNSQIWEKTKEQLTKIKTWRGKHDFWKYWNDECADEQTQTSWKYNPPPSIWTTPKRGGIGGFWRYWNGLRNIDEKPHKYKNTIVKNKTWRWSHWWCLEVLELFVGRWYKISQISL